MFEPDTTFAFGEEGLHCPKCGVLAVIDDDTTPVFVAECPRSLCEVDTFLAAFADPQCGECREFLDDPTAEDDSLCATCKENDNDRTQQ